MATSPDSNSHEPCKPPRHSQPTPSRKASRPTPSASNTGQERSSRIGGPSRDGAALALLG